MPPATKPLNVSKTKETSPTKAGDPPLSSRRGSTTAKKSIKTPGTVAQASHRLAKADEGGKAKKETKKKDAGSSSSSAQEPAAAPEATVTPVAFVGDPTESPTKDDYSKSKPEHDAAWAQA